MFYIKRLSIENLAQIKAFFFEVFTKEPWNDDWGDDVQLEHYLCDLAGNINSLTFGLYDDNEIVGLAIGSIRHWYEGTEYHIDEFCIKTSEQGKGLGTYFINQIEEIICSEGIKRIFLQTNRGLPAYNFYIKNGFMEIVNHVSLNKNIIKT